VPPGRIGGSYSLPYNDFRPLSREETSRDHRGNENVKREESSRSAASSPGDAGIFQSARSCEISISGQTEIFLEPTIGSGGDDRPSPASPGIPRE